MSASTDESRHAGEASDALSARTDAASRLRSPRGLDDGAEQFVASARTSQLM